MKASEGAEPLDRAVRLSQLLDLYGALLTERQRQFVKLHYEDDFSFGEISREFNISRQAVHDAVKHAEQSLEEYDAKLRLSPLKVRRRGGPEAGGSAPGASEAPAAAAPALSQEGLQRCIQRLEEVQDRLRRSGGVIYNTDGITRDIAEVLQQMRQLQPGGQA